jgi:hypothetical protein
MFVKNQLIDFLNFFTKSNLLENLMEKKRIKHYTAAMKHKTFSIEKTKRATIGNLN